ncbi:MAG: TetR/AcrR family transcriptional regulator [Lachnospiraceae bacterium]|nr:TetR/AcrR family transcriptional regulator [Lachnospiraceae bacterium]
MDRRIKKTRRAIYAAYFRAKHFNPKEQPSVKEICALADINKTTFYRYFSDINALIQTLISDIVNTLLIEDIETECLLTNPESYFRQVIERYKTYDADYTMVFNDYPNVFIFTAESMIKNKLIEATNKKYDDILLTFIAGGAVHFFVEKNYYDAGNLNKFCRIVKAAVNAL